MTVVPNPYSGRTNITFSLDADDEVVIEVLNTMGQRVALLHDGNQSKGDYKYEFSAKALGFATGIYTVRVIVGGKFYSKRIIELE
ncbi:MAG: T9SS type A sorting domain-containing protein [Bacteroidetes bacterium]|nr:T9SS type A sorting domain-containing protein [Bacteroidota bacterium]